MEQTALNFGTIVLAGIEMAGTPGNAERLILTDGQTKFTLWASKKDKSPTKAKLAYDAIKPQIGTAISIGVKEEPAQFQDKEGKTVNFMRRTIMWLGTPTANSQPYAPIYQTQPPQTPQPKPAPVQQPANPVPTGTLPPAQAVPDPEEAPIDVSSIPF